MRIDELCEYAKDNGFDSLEFEFTNLLGETKKCKWLDAYFGMFQIEGNLLQLSNGKKLLVMFLNLDS